VIVEPDFADRDRLQLLYALFECLKASNQVVGVRPGVVRMNPGREPRRRPEFFEPRGRGIFVGVMLAENAKDAGNTGSLRAIDDVGQVRRELASSEVAMGIDHLYRTRTPGGIS